MALALSDVEIAQVVDELAPLVRGGSVAKAHARDRYTVVLELGRKTRLLLSVHPQASRLHLEGARPPGGAAPAAFAMLLRKHLGGLRVADLTVDLPGERVVRLAFGANKARLVAELGGPTGNIYLLDAGDLLLGSLRPAARGLVAGAPYTPPEAAPAHARWRGLARFGSPPGVADRVATELEADLAAGRVADLRVRAAVELRRRRLRLERRLAGLAADMTRIDDAAVYRKWGDLILAHLAQLGGPRTEPWITVPDLFADGEPPLRIAVDPALSIKDNADRYYKQHRRLTGRRGYVQDRIARAVADLEEAARLLDTLDTLDEPRLAALVPGAAEEEAAPPPGARRRRPAPPPPRLPYREFTSPAGDVIWVGRSARDNDAMRGHARGNDLWLHTRDAPGSHVILRLADRRAPSPEALVDAATLAAHFSPLTREAQVDVQYAHVKNLRKPKGAAPGLVTVSSAKTIRVRLEPSRLERLLRKDDD